MSPLISLRANSSKILHREGRNCLDISFFHRLKGDTIFQDGSFSIKYVIEGKETYKIGNENYDIVAKEYVLANHHFEGSVVISEPTKGICIDLDMDLIFEVLEFQISQRDNFPLKELQTYFNSLHYVENKYDARQTKLGTLLISLESDLVNERWNPKNMTKDFYYSIAEALIEDNLETFHKFNSVSAVKKITKKEICRKVMIAKDYIDIHFREDINILNIARESCLSEYHFYRVFKGIMDSSPYQYLIQKRLKFAEKEIHKHEKVIAEIAIEAGFSDIHAFSKSFKKSYGMSPRAFYQYHHGN